MSARFLVRESYSEYGPSCWRLWDAVDRRWLETFARREAAEAEAKRLERAWRARLSIVPAPVPADPPGGTT